MIYFHATNRILYSLQNSELCNLQSKKFIYEYEMITRYRLERSQNLRELILRCSHDCISHALAFFFVKPNFRDKHAYNFHRFGL